MIKIIIDGSDNTGKTLLTMRIARMLQEEGVDVTVLTENVPHEIPQMFYDTRIDELTPKYFQCEIHDTNGQLYNPLIHVKYGFKGVT